MNANKMGLKFSITQVCKMFGISRQAFYKQRKSMEAKQLQERILIELVLPIRYRMPQVGGKKLYYMLKADIKSMDLNVGRDKFFKVLKSNNLLAKPWKKYCKTTNSRHRFRIYNNLIKGMEINKSNQVFGSDITYLRVGDRFHYLALITDLYSRKIVGFDLSNSLSIEGSIRALKMALNHVKDPEGLIHHSDRGIQYCSNAYIDLLRKHKVEISMAEKGNPYENAIAERVNGILKIEFMLNQRFKSKQLAGKAVNEAIETYNAFRPHTSINYSTPNHKYYIAA